MLERSLLKKGETKWTLIEHGDDYYDSLLREMDFAEKSIYIEVYILEPDTIGQKILDKLVDKARQGLDVRLIVDGVGSLNLLREKGEFLEKSPFRYRVYRPINILSFLQWRKNHRRNHRKLISIDGKICYLGGMNIKNAHSKKISGDNAWRDMMIRLEGRVAYDADQNFHLMWERMPDGPLHLARAFQRRHIARRDFLIVENIPFTRRIRYRILFLRAIRSAKESIYLQTAYFVPRLFLIRALRKMAEKGVDVRILLNENSDVNLARWAGRASYSALLRKGVRIYERKGRFSHAKVMVVDDRISILGSTNMDYRSFMHNLEVDVISRRIDLSHRLKEIFMNELDRSREIHYHRWRKRGLWHRVLEKTAFLFRYWL